MKSNVIMGIMLTLLLIGVLTFAFNIRSVEAEGLIYMRAHDPEIQPDGNILLFDNGLRAQTK